MLSKPIPSTQEHIFYTIITKVHKHIYIYPYFGKRFLMSICTEHLTYVQRHITIFLILALLPGKTKYPDKLCTGLNNVKTKSIVRKFGHIFTSQSCLSQG